MEGIPCGNDLLSSGFISANAGISNPVLSAQNQEVHSSGAWDHDWSGAGGCFGCGEAAWDFGAGSPPGSQEWAWDDIAGSAHWHG
jgi:hypothetical protein